MIVNKISTNPTIKTINQRRNNLKKQTVFEGKMNLSDSLKIGTAIAASAMLSLSQEPPQDFLEEYYKNENSKFSESNLGVNISRFSEQEKYEIFNNADDIKLRPGVFMQIINLENEDKTPRFNAEDAIKLYLDAGEQIQAYPEIFNAIVEAKDEKGKERFNSYDCAILMQKADLFSSDKETLNILLALKNEDNTYYYKSGDAKNLIKNFRTCYNL